MAIGLKESNKDGYQPATGSQGVDDKDAMSMAEEASMLPAWLADTLSTRFY